MTADGDLLLKAVLADPGDDTVRLVYADWLQENGQDARAEFVRAQCVCARHAATRPAEPSDDWACLCGYAPCDGYHHNSPTCPYVRAGLLFDDHAYGWCDGLLGPEYRTHGHVKFDRTVSVDYRRSQYFRTNDMYLTFERGFVGTVLCEDHRDWIRHGDVVRTVQPVTKVLFDDVPQLSPVFGAEYVSLLHDPKNVWFKLDTILAGASPFIGLTPEFSLAVCAARWPGITFK